MDQQPLYERAAGLQRRGQLAEAERLYLQILALQPDHVEALTQRALVLRQAGRLEEALAGFGKVLAVKPDHVAVLIARGNILWQLRRHAESLASYDAALAIHPRFAELHDNRGIALWNLKRFEDALMAFDMALALKPDFADAAVNRGNALRDLGRFEEALASYERALARAPGQLYALDGAANMALALCDWVRGATFEGEIAARVATGKSVISPVTLLGYSGDTALQRRCAENYIRQKLPARPSPLWTGKPYRHGRIRIAYVSADFNRHPVACQLAELIERHDRSRFEVLGVSLGDDDGSEIRARLAGAFDAFHDMRTQDGPAVAVFLRRLETDIAVDLGGHTKDSRPDIFAARPAPVQVSYLGFPATTGADFIDYVIADRIVAPEDQQAFFSEMIVRLPDSYFPSGTRRTVGPTPSRAQAGLPEQGFVFCCFNKSWKIAAPVFAVWMRLLAAIPDGVLWLKADRHGARKNLRAAAAARGIDPERLVFAGHLDDAAHLARHRLADVFLDTLPYNAHATVCDALWAGLPVVTCRGTSFSGRVGASLLEAAGLPELVTKNPEQYEALALKLARDPALLQSFRQRLVDNRATHALFNADRYRRNIETAYVKMWEIAERGEPPQSFAVVSGPPQ